MRTQKPTPISKAPVSVALGQRPPRCLCPLHPTLPSPRSPPASSFQGNPPPNRVARPPAARPLPQAPITGLPLLLPLITHPSLFLCCVPHLSAVSPHRPLCFVARSSPPPPFALPPLAPTPLVVAKPPGGGGSGTRGGGGTNGQTATSLPITPTLLLPPSSPCGYETLWRGATRLAAAPRRDDLCDALAGTLYQHHPPPPSAPPPPHRRFAPLCGALLARPLLSPLRRSGREGGRARGGSNAKASRPLSPLRLRRALNNIQQRHHQKTKPPTTAHYQNKTLGFASLSPPVFSPHLPFSITLSGPLLLSFCFGGFGHCPNSAAALAGAAPGCRRRRLRRRHHTPPICFTPPGLSS